MSSLSLTHWSANGRCMELLFHEKLGAIVNDVVTASGLTCFFRGTVKPSSNVVHLRVNWYMSDEVRAFMAVLSCHGFRLNCMANPKQWLFCSFARDEQPVEDEELVKQVHALGASLANQATSTQHVLENVSQQLELVQTQLMAEQKQRGVLVPQMSEHRTELEKVLEHEREVWQQDAACLHADRDRFAAELAAQRKDLGELRELLAAEREEGRARLEAVERQREGLKEQLATAQSFAPPLEELEVPAAGGRRAEMHVRIACPGIEEDRIDIEPVTNGVAVKIREGTSEDDVVIFERTFVYRGYELSVDDCGLDCGILTLILKRAVSKKLKLSRTYRSPLVGIDEEAPAAPLEVTPQVFRLTPSSSVSSLPSISSGWVVPKEDSSVTDVDASSVAEELDHQSAVSAPPAVHPTQCLLQTARVLCEDGGTVEVKELKPGAKLRALLPHDGDATLGFATVRAVRTSLPRESDFVELTMDNASKSVLQVTGTHRMLVYSEELGWSNVPAREMRENRQLFLVSKEGPEDMHSVRSVQSVRKFVESQKVVEVELESKADALFVQLSDGDFVAVLGSPGWSKNYEVRSKRTFVDVEPSEHVSEGASSKSDPIHKRKQAVSSIYCCIIRPHDAQCKAWCTKHFTPGGCKRSQLCMMCHSPEHKEEASQQKPHRGARH